MNNTYELNPDVFYEHPENFKQKSTLILKKLLETYLVDFINFSGYAIITTEGDRQEKFIIEETDKFSRAKINCLVYTLKQNKYNDINTTGFDKLFIYYTKLNKTQLYSFFMYNTITGASKHIYYIDMADDILATRIKNTIVFNGTTKIIYQYFSEKYDFAKNKHTDRYNRHTITEYNEMVKNYRNVISKSMYE